MGLSAGSRLGPYEIESPLGVGGMGEVYRARDTRLERTVAIKILNSALAATPDLKARFEREAKTISQLNHPHICTLHDVGSHDGAEYLVMEYLEGESLANRLKRGPLPLPELLKIGCDIADALDRAHRAGIVHRDLKPGNVMLTKSGAKLLDFGLAKPASMGAVAGSGTAPLLSAAMTMTSPSPQQSPLTQHGALIGTVQYMSPEQIQGMEADARSDIFAFGAMLYEMATAKRAFEGKSQISVASAILEKEIEPISSHDQASPPALDRIIATCTAKDPEDRFSSAHDVKLELGWLATAPRKEPAAVVQTVAAPRRALAKMVAVVILFAAAAAAFAYWFATRTPKQVVHAVITTPDKLVLDATGDFAGPAVISPDGTAIAFSAHMPGSPRALWVRRLAESTVQQLEGTDEAAFPFWSPDSRQIAFFAHSKLNRVNASGGPVLAIADSPAPRGGSWSSGVILFDPDFQSPLMRVSPQGGAVTQVTTLDTTRHTTHRWPWLLPDGKHFLFLATNHNGGVHEQNGIYFGSIESKETHLVVVSDSGGEFADGYLLFHAQNALMAQPFDPSSGKLSGDAAVVVDHVAHDPGVWRTIFSVSSTGNLAFQGGAASTGSELTFVDRSGKEVGHLGERAPYSTIRISPDGKRLVAAVGDPKPDLWIFDLARGGAPTRLTFEQAVDNPSWSSDGSLIYYNSFPGAHVLLGSATSTVTAVISVKRSDGSGASKVVVQEPPIDPRNAVPSAAMAPQLEPGGKNLLYIRADGPSGHTIVSAPAGGGGKETHVVAPGSPQANIIDFRLSPDGHWLAYTSNEAGQLQTFLVPYPNAGAGKWQVSSNGGQYAAWRSDSKELFYFGSDNRVYAVPFDGREAQPQIGTPQPLFSIPNTAFNGFYEPMPDGKRFLLNRVPEQASTPISILLNWPETLKRK